MLNDLLKFNHLQIHRLFTHEDGKYLHIHKLFGVLSLLHFIYRFYLLIMYKSMMFSPDIYTFLPMVCHSMLHITSFQFILPKNRNFVYNIIYPEMRFHTTIFGFRSIITFLINLYLPHYRFVTPIMVYLTMILADLATNHYKNKGVENRTTMRSNAYPSYFSDTLINILNLYYSTMQFAATTSILYYSPYVIFKTLLPIQIAPFLMTLQKKGIISQGGWHLYYSLSLLLGLLVIGNEKEDVSVKLFTITVFTLAFLRFKFRVNKYILWSLPVYLSVHRMTNRLTHTV